MAEDDDKKPWEENYATGTATATGEKMPWEESYAQAPAPPTDEEIEKSYGKNVSPKIREALKSGVAPMTKPTQTEQQNPPVSENLGFNWQDLKKTPGQFLRGIGTAGKFAGGVLGDITNPNKPLFFGGAEEGPKESTFHKYVIHPQEEELEKAVEDPNVISKYGHAGASLVPFLGPWMAGHAENFGKTGNLPGEVASTAGEYAGGRLLEKGGQLAGAGTIKGIAAAAPPLGEIAGRTHLGTGKLTGGEPIVDTAKDVVNELVREDPNVAAQRALRPPAKRALRTQDNLAGARPYLEGAATLAELQQKVVGGLKEVWKPYADALSKIGEREVEGPDGLTTLNNLEAKRLELSAERQKLQNLMPTDRATALQKDADLRANEQRYNAYQDVIDHELNSAGVDGRTIRKTFGQLKGIQKLIEGRNTLTEADRAYGLGRIMEDFHITKPLRSLWKGGVPGVQDILAGRPWFKGKPTDVAVAEGFREGTGGEKPDFTAKAPGPQYPQPAGPLAPQYAKAAGPEPAPGPFQMEDLAPNRGELWQQQVGQPPPLETGAPTPGRHIEPIGPQPQAEAPLGPIQGQQLPLNLPPGPGEAPLFGIEHPAPRTAAPEVPAAAEGGLAPIGGPGREGTLGKIDLEPRKTAVEDLKVGDTFVDDKGDPRRITEITEDGTVKTADHTLRDFKQNEIDHLGEINSPRAQLARGGVFHPPEEAVAGEEERHDLGEIGGIEKKGEEVKPMTPPGGREEVPRAEEQKIGEPEKKEFLDAIKKLNGDTELAEEQWDDMNDSERAHALDRYRGQLVGKGPRTEPVQSAEKAIESLKERVKDRSHNGEERDYQVLKSGEVNPRQLYQTTFLLDDGSALQGDMGIKSHMQLAREVGQHHLNDANAIRVVTPDSFELHNMPSDAQLAEMNRYFRDLPREERQNVHDAGYVYWDFYPKEVTGYSADAVHADHESGAGSFADFRRAIDKYYSPTTTTEISPDGSSVKLMENPLTVKGTGEKGRVSTADLLKALNKYTKQSIGKLTLEKAEPEEMVERAKSLAEDEAKYQLTQDNSGAAWYTKQMDEHDAIAQQMRPALRDPAKLSIFKMAEAVLSSGQKPYGNFKSTIKAWDAYEETGKFPRLNPENGKSWGPRGEAAYGNALDMINDLIDEHGEKGASDWLLSEHPVSELRKYNDGVSGKADAQRPGVIILGEKRGPFAQNLHKIESAFTADMWVARTWNRWMGTAEIDPKTGEIASDAPRNDSERALMRQAFDATAEKLGLSTSALQAVLWYYEQALHNAHGVPKESWSFSDAAKRASDEEAGIATKTKSGKAVKPKPAGRL